MATTSPSATGPLSWTKSLLWLALAVAYFHAAYTSIHHPAAGLLIFGYAFGLVKLTDQPNVRRAFYFGLATGFLCYAPQLFFFFRIFNIAAIVLWLVLAFWVGLFAALGQSQNRVANSDHLDGHRILPQRTLLPEIFVDECWLCFAPYRFFLWNVWRGIFCIRNSDSVFVLSALD
jgi:hypothetical protein